MGQALITMPESAGLEFAQDLRSDVWHWVAQGGQSLAVDVSRASALASPVLAALVSADRYLAARGGQIRILRPRPPVADLLEQAGLGRRLASPDITTD